MPRRLSFVSLAPPVLLALFVVGACADPPAAVPDEPGAGVRLVVVLAIDQLRSDRLSEFLPGGIGRLTREGRVFLDAALEHAFTETCPGHATMLTGRHPARIGIPGNSYTDPQTLEQRYCVEDRSPDAALLGPGSRSAVPADGRSPQIMRSSGLGAWMKARRPGTRVFSVSGKDRAAITMGGREADAAYWLARGENPGWVTSRYYMDAVPKWVAAWGKDRVLAGLPQEWVYLPGTVTAASQGPRIDDYPHESSLLSRTQPHPLLRDRTGSASAIARHPAERRPMLARHPAERLYVTPYADRVTLAFAKDLVEAEKLGSGDGPDLLTISLSATDLVGHFYGPESWESRDALARLDAMVGEFLTFLEKRVGKAGLFVVLTADHGVLPVPEWIQERKRSKCPVAGGRVAPKPLLVDLERHLDERFVETNVPAGMHWFALAGRRLTLDRAHLGGEPSLEARVIAAATTYLEAHPAIERVWTREEVLSGGGPEPMATFYRNSWAPEIAGDLAVQVAEDCLFAGRRIATSHGSPYLYDRAVPLVFFGPGVEVDRVIDRAAPVDIAPTLADYLGISAPLGLEGKVLRLKMR
jgi:hypothetical protein